jgi:hypothetical protein
LANYNVLWTGYLLSTNYYQLAQLPATGASTGECVYIEVTSNTTSISGKSKLTVSLGQRGGLWYVKSYEGSGTQFHIRVYQPSVGGVSNVYLYNTSTNYASATAVYYQYGWGSPNGIGATLYANPTGSTSTPTGTVIFDSSSDVTYPVNDTLVTGTVTATDFNTTSDQNLKTNIKPVQSSLSKLLQLNGVTFDWKSTSQPAIGVIAQDVEKIFPELVSQNLNYKTVRYNGLIGVLIEAIKELSEKVEKLEKNC